METNGHQSLGVATVSNRPSMNAPRLGPPAGDGLALPAPRSAERFLHSLVKIDRHEDAKSPAAATKENRPRPMKPDGALATDK